MKLPTRGFPVRYSFYSVPVDPAYKAGLAGHLPATITPYYFNPSFEIRPRGLGRNRAKWMVPLTPLQEMDCLSFDIEGCFKNGFRHRGVAVNGRLQLLNPHLVSHGH